MTSCRLNEALSTGIFDMRPTEESPAIKAKNRKWRASMKELERLQHHDDCRRDCKIETRNDRDRFRSSENVEHVGNVKSVQH